MLDAEHLDSQMFEISVLDLRPIAVEWNRRFLPGHVMTRPSVSRQRIREELAWVNQSPETQRSVNVGACNAERIAGTLCTEVPVYKALDVSTTHLARRRIRR
jgi:hypothetical protein